MKRTARAPEKPKAPQALPAALLPRLPELLDPRGPFLVPAALLLFTRIYLSYVLPNGAEDAYITFRYAENWASGLGPVYNVGERVMGYSSPLWTAWTALGALLTGQTLVWARITSTILDLATLVLGAGILLRASRTSAWAWGLFFALFPLFAAYAVLGLETSLLLFLVVASAACASSRHPAAGVPLGLLALTRPEGVLAAAIIGLGATWRARLTGLALLAIGALALTLYYGSPIPQSVLAKAATYGMPGPRAGFDWISGFLPFFFGHWPSLPEPLHLFPLALVGTPAAIVALGPLFRQRGTIALVALSGLAVLAAYALIGVPYFAWYFVLPLAAWGWAASLGLPTISRHRFLYAALVLYLISDFFYLGQIYKLRAGVEAVLFAHTSEALQEASGGQGTVFLEPIGIIGYRCRMRVIDEVGLVSPQVRRRREQGAGWYADIVRQERPDFLVVRLADLRRNESFAGAHAPFRSASERDAVLAAYAEVSSSGDETNKIAILRRR